MLNVFPLRTLAVCLGLSALMGCRDYVAMPPYQAPTPEPPQLQYRLKRLVAGECSGSGVVTTDFTYVRDLFVARTSQYQVVREQGTPTTTYTYDAGGRLLKATFDDKIKRMSGQQEDLFSYTYTPSSIVEQVEVRYADGHQEFGTRRTYSLAGGLITGYKEQYLDTGVPITNQWTYEYTGGNLTRVVGKGQNGQIKADFRYEYDDKPNPFYRNATYNWVGSQWAGISMECLSRNNVVKSTVRSPFNNALTVRTRQYTYNQQGLPLTQTRDDDGCQVARYEYETY